MPGEVLKRFDFGINVTKAYKGQDGKSYIKGIASDTGVDHHGERFSEDALKGMVSCIKSNSPAPVILLPTHYDTFEIGKAVDAKIIPSPTHDELKALDVTIELDMEYPQAKALYKEIDSGNALKQMSVGGYLDPNSEEPYFWEEKTYETPDGKTLNDYTLVLNSLVLDHIAVTRKDQAANPRTGFSQAIAKSLGLEKPENPQLSIKHKEVEDKMSKAEKQSETLIEMISKSISSFFKSNTEAEVAIDAAKLKAQEALEVVKGIEGAEHIKEQLESILKVGAAPATGNNKSPEAAAAENEDAPNGATQKSAKDPDNDGDDDTDPSKDPDAAEDEKKKAKEDPDGDGDNDADPAQDPDKDGEKVDPKAKKSISQNPDEKASVVDIESLKSQIVEDITKSINDDQHETFKEISKSLGEVIAQTIKSAVEPLQTKITELENFAGKSKGLQGQESDAPVVKSVGNEESDNLWSGIIKSALPKHILNEKLMDKEGE